MTTDDAISSLTSFLGKIDVPIFFVGTIKDSCDAVNLLSKELLDDLVCGGIPFPFQRLILLERVDEETLELAKKANICDRHIEWLAQIVEAVPGKKYAITETSFCYEGSWRKISTGSRDLVDRTLNPQSRPGRVYGRAAAILALICHPQNYIIRESPKLTDHELKRVRSGKRFPAAKAPRYIVVDHDVLLGIRCLGGTHASPVPHQRRGHWMRLSERCRHARERGLEKVWVRDAYVGETDFIQNGRRYQVLLDFQDKVKAGTVPI